MVTPRLLHHVGGDDQLRRVRWTTDRHGYCYAARDPLTDKPRLRCCYRLPAYVVRRQSRQGMRVFQPDACLINRYARRKTVAASG